MGGYEVISRQEPPTESPQVEVEPFGLATQIKGTPERNTRSKRRSPTHATEEVRRRKKTQPPPPPQRPPRKHLKPHHPCHQSEAPTNQCLLNLNSRLRRRARPLP